ncbi:Serine/threonine-protein kinase KIN3 [Pseudocercospora fuligena]|uniref:non-specific serine/threonine protein kinase n=1 Tax=Pseudocercospora fuligena TaxID=685502 RepID=A0A8H6VLJ4_9PEZI|nr:Serine/threonine-protein kinase KIN3 [Pseudocercospora fuligena]
MTEISATGLDRSQHSYRHTIPEAALRVCDTQSYEKKEHNLHAVAPSLRNALMRAERKHAIRREDIAGISSIAAALQAANIAALSPESRSYPRTDGATRRANGFKEAVTTRKQAYGTPPVTRKDRASKPRGDGTRKQGGLTAGKKLDAGDGSGSDGSDDNKRPKRPLPRDADERPRKRRKNNKAQRQESSETAKSETEAQGSVKPDGQRTERSETPSVARQWTSRPRHAATLTVPGGGGGDPDDSSEGSSSDRGGASDRRDSDSGTVRAGRSDHDDRNAADGDDSLPDYESEEPVRPVRSRQYTADGFELLRPNLSGVDLMTLNDLQIGNSSRHLQDYVADILSEDRPKDATYATKAINLVKQLTEIYGRGRVWADAGDIENYVTFGIDENEIWEDLYEDGVDDPEDDTADISKPDGPRWDRQWSRVAIELDCVQEFKGLWVRAKRVAEVPALDEDLHITLDDVAGRSANRYLSDLEGKIKHYEWRATVHRWQVCKNFFHANEDSAGLLAAQLETKLAEMDQTYQSASEKVDPREEFWNVAWEWLSNKAESEVARRQAEIMRAKDRFDDLFALVLNLQNERQLVPPPAWQKNMSVEDYCEEVTEAIDDQRKRSLQEARTAWEHAIAVNKALENIERVSELERGLEELEWRVDKGGQPFSIQDWDNSDLPEFDQPPKDAAEMAQAIGFDGDRAAFVETGAWEFSNMLGSGGYGTVSLWTRKDDSGNITGRIAIKEAYLGPRPGKSKDQWNNARLWCHPMSVRYPLEAGIMRRLNDLEHSESVVRNLAYASYDAKKMFRLYMEYCEHGDLNELVKAYVNAGRHIPVSVLWSMFEALATALCLMENGRLPTLSSIQPESWTPIVHLDIKPHNIFLKQRKATEFWPETPQTVLGDFGLAQQYTEPIGPGQGTRGYRSPEQHVYDDDHPRSRDQMVGPKSDVWVVGRVMLTLMERETRTINIPDITFDDPEDVPSIKPAIYKYYDKRDPKLVQTVLMCLLKEPDTRIGSEQLFVLVHDEITKLSDGEQAAWKTMEKPEGEVMPLDLVYEDMTA